MTDARGHALDTGQIASGLDSPDRFRLHSLTSTASTNDDIRRLAGDGHPEGTVVFAEEQTAGRGRRGRTWETPRGQGLLFSVLLRPSHPPALWPRVTHLAALAICRALAPLLPVEPRIKWPNDVLVHHRKLSGILLESVAPSEASGSPSGGFLILGIGVNIHQTGADFSPELRETATSLMLESGREHPREECAARILNAFGDLYPDAVDPFEAILAEIHEKSALPGRAVTIRQEGGGELHGTVSGFGPNGELAVDLENGARSLLSAGELVGFRTG